MIAYRINPSLRRTANSWEHGASFPTNKAVSFPEDENSILCLQAFHVLINVIENSTVSKNMAVDHAGKPR